MKTNLLYISPDFNHSCGVSRNVYQCLIHFSSDLYYNVHFITNGGDSLERLNGLNVNTHIINFKKNHKNIFYLIRDSIRLYSYCKKNKIDIIHTHHRYPELLSVLVSMFTGIKTITTVHSFIKGLKTVSLRSDKIISVSKAVEDHLYKNYPHSKVRCKTIYNCIDESFYKTRDINTKELRKSLKFNDSDKIILFVGRISKIKGVDTLISAFVKINEQFENVKLILLGQVEDLNISEAIKGFEHQISLVKPTENIMGFYQISDILVLASRIDPFPYVMIEAGAMKKPFIGSRTGGIAEFIEDGANGLLFEPENVEELTIKILYTFENSDTARRMADNLYKKVKKGNNYNAYFTHLGNIYNTLLSVR